MGFLLDLEVFYLAGMPERRNVCVGVGVARCNSRPNEFGSPRTKRSEFDESSMSRKLVLALACGHLFNAASAREANNPAFMLVSGISAPTEMCVVVEDGKLVWRIHFSHRACLRGMSR